jgi:hypothetical protein
VIAIVDRPDLRSKSDEEVFAWASAERRWLLTENVKDFRPIMLRSLLAGPPGCGLLFTSSRAFPRFRKNPGSLIGALHAWLTAGAPAHSSPSRGFSAHQILRDSVAGELAACQRGPSSSGRGQLAVSSASRRT